MKQLFTVGTKDFIKGFVVAIGTSLLTGVSVSLNSGALPTQHEFKIIGMTAVAAAITYISKNFLTNSQNQILVKEPCKVPAVPVVDATKTDVK